VSATEYWSSSIHPSIIILHLLSFPKLPLPGHPLDCFDLCLPSWPYELVVLGAWAVSLVVDLRSQVRPSLSACSGLPCTRHASMEVGGIIGHCEDLLASPGFDGLILICKNRIPKSKKRSRRTSATPKLPLFRDLISLGSTPNENQRLLLSPLFLKCAQRLGSYNQISYHHDEPPKKSQVQLYCHTFSIPYSLPL
jgi:hypothetical protein